MVKRPKPNNGDQLCGNVIIINTECPLLFEYFIIVKITKYFNVQILTFIKGDGIAIPKYHLILIYSEMCSFCCYTNDKYTQWEIGTEL